MNETFCLPGLQGFLIGLWVNWSSIGFNSFPFKRVTFFVFFFFFKRTSSKACNLIQGFPVNSDDKDSDCKAEDPGAIPGSERSPGEGNGYPLQYSCLENSTDRGAWRATVHRVAKSQTRLSDEHSSIYHVTEI